MKWSKKTAQGFSPGSEYYGTRPERAAEFATLFPRYSKDFGRSFIQNLLAIGSMSSTSTSNTSVGCPFSTSNPLRGCNSDLAQYANIPSLRAAGFEDDDDEND
jgi:hypothetical protein